MHFYNPCKRVPAIPSIVMADFVVERVDSIKYLGLTLDSHLSWNVHVDQTASKIRSLVGILYRLKSRLPRDVKKLIYSSMVQSHLIYMIEIWGTASNTRLKSLQTMQNRALRNVFDIPYLTPRLEIYSELSQGTLPVKALYELSISKFVFSVLKGYSSSEVSFTSASHGYQSRHRGLLARPRCRTESAKRRISYSGPLIYDSLPSNCKNSRNPRKFKFTVKQHLSSRNQIARLII